MVEIKDVYETFDSKTLDEDIMQNYSSNLQSILLGLVKGKEQWRHYGCGKGAPHQGHSSGEPPRVPYICHHFVWAQIYFSHRGSHPRSAATDKESLCIWCLLLLFINNIFYLLKLSIYTCCD